MRHPGLDDGRGPIPAQAGEPDSLAMTVAELEAYPRAGGGTLAPDHQSVHRQGLSPRRRGNPPHDEQGLARGGPIPAQAGEPRSCCRRSARPRAYPRAGGGTRRSRCLSCLLLLGLSPRRRGNRIRRTASPRGIRPIPAQAGEPCSARRSGKRRRAYPRAGGGTESSSARSSGEAGLSPRRRGNLDVGERDQVIEGPIPAQAGEPRWRRARRRADRAYPRAGGGTIVHMESAGLGGGLSPRRRGNRGHCALALERVGPIPAQAGEPRGLDERRALARAYPRAGGGTERALPQGRASMGLSPRRRGNLDSLMLLIRPALGPIPAQAGEPLVPSL